MFLFGGKIGTFIMIFYGIILLTTHSLKLITSIKKHVAEEQQKVR